MITQKTVQQLQHAPIKDRIQAIEVLLESLKQDITHPEFSKKHRRPFRVRTFDLDTPNPEVEKAWANEALKRLQAYKEGKLKTISFEETFS